MSKPGRVRTDITDDVMVQYEDFIYGRTIIPPPEKFSKKMTDVRFSVQFTRIGKLRKRPDLVHEASKVILAQASSEMYRIPGGIKKLCEQTLDQAFFVKGWNNDKLAAAARMAFMPMVPEAAIPFANRQVFAT